MRQTAIAILMITTTAAAQAEPHRPAPSPFAYADPAGTQPASLAPTATPPTASLGGAGESCRARADCRPGLMCVAQTCRDAREGTTCGSTSECGGELRCVEQRCVAPFGSHPRGAGSARSFTLDGVHPFVGLAGGGGYTHSFWFGVGSAGYEGGQFTLRGGVLVNRTEIALELSPVTMWLRSQPSFALTLSVGHLLRLSKHVYWPLRFGIGVTAVNTPKALFSTQFDLLALGFQVGRFFIEVTFPTVRFSTEFSEWGLLSLLPRLNLAVAF